MARAIDVVLTNRKATLNFGPGGLFDEVNEFLKYRKPGWEYTNAAKFNGWDGFLHLMQGNRVGTGVFLSLKEKMEKEFGIKFKVDDKRKSPELDNTIVYVGSYEVRPYQKQCLMQMIYASKTGGLILNSTGTGKTFITGLYLKSLKGPALFLVDELTLLKQAIEELREVLREDIGEIGNSIFRPRRITVATVQTIHRHRFDMSYVPWTRTLKAIIIDEVHLALNRRNFQTVAAIHPPVIFGLTATLELKKKSVAYRAYDLCGPVVFEYPLEKGVAEGFLSKGIAVSVQVEQGVKEEKIKGNPRWAWVRARYKQKYHELYRDVIVEGKKRNQVILDLVKTAYRQGKHIVVLLSRVQHLKDLSKRLDGIPHRLVFGEVAVVNRVAAQKSFEADKLKVILTNVVFKKGINIKKIDVIIDGAGMKSKNDAVQKYGRGVRLCDGKDGLLYFDIADSGNRFEKAAASRASALKRTKIPVFKISSEKGAKEILRLAEAKLKKELAA